MSAAGRQATLPRASRLLQRADYVTALAARPVALRRHFSVFVHSNAVGRARLGITVSKKVAPRAVDRNRIKRLVREVFRQERRLLGGNDLVILARRCPPREGWQAVRAELAALFGQLARQLHQQSGC